MGIKGSCRSHCELWELWGVNGTYRMFLGIIRDTGFTEVIGSYGNYGELMGLKGFECLAIMRDTGFTGVT